jgi:hypothetical protein
MRCRSSELGAKSRRHPKQPDDSPSLQAHGAHVSDHAPRIARHLVSRFALGDLRYAARGAGHGNKTGEVAAKRCSWSGNVTAQTTRAGAAMGRAFVGRRPPQRAEEWGCAETVEPPASVDRTLRVVPRGQGTRLRREQVHVGYAARPSHGASA